VGRSSARPQGSLIFFILGWVGLGWGGGEDFFPFSLVPNVFLSCSHHVLPMLLNMSIEPHFYPICFGKCCLPLAYIHGPKGMNNSLLLLWGLFHVCSLSEKKDFLFHITPTSEWNGVFHFRIVQSFNFQKGFFPHGPINQFLTELNYTLSPTSHNQLTWITLLKVSESDSSIFYLWFQNIIITRIISSKKLEHIFGIASNVPWMKIILQILCKT